MSNAKTKPLKSLRAAFEVIDYLKRSGGAGVTDVANELSLPKSTAHVYLTSLEEIGYAVNANGTYRVGLRFLDIGETARAQKKIYEVGCPEVDRLANETGELASMMIQEHGHGVYLYRNGGEQAMPAKSYVGKHVDLHCRASGKAILSELPRAEVEHIVEEKGLVRRTERTITDPDELLEELVEVSKRGYAVNDGELRKGLRCVAAPICRDGSAVGAISVSGPEGRLQGERFEEEIPKLVKNAANIVEITASYS
ncbi:IclR family transcriptional regulator [Haloarchaeobius sp. TZWSO28]|uniref:IclR family transcriptional regulator n=1 Tax=Haloarchaeobius sp. TZWSO28 TaxID=3446119 RepID=UPI003EB82133